MKSKSLIDTVYSEQIEYLSKLDNDNYLIALNKFPPNSSNAKAYFARSDSNFVRLKEFIYGDTINYQYWLRDLIEVSGGQMLVAMSQFKTSNDIQYHIVRYNHNLEIDTNTYPVKNYDYKCQNSITKFDIVFDSNFDTISIKDTPSLLFFSSLKAPNKDDVLVYPNPNDGRFFIYHSFEEPVFIHIYDIRGVLIYFSKLETNEAVSEFNKSDLKSGVYILKLTSSKKSVVKKIVIE
jgi:hypothetical protein